MTLSQAKSFARQKTLKATALLLAILTLLLLLGETRGDLANGILFFMAAITNVHTVLIVTILFGLTYFLAGLAGKEIILEKRNIFLVSLKYVIALSLALSLYAMSIGFFRESDFSYSAVVKAFPSNFFGLFLKTFVSLLLVWLWATNKMKTQEA